VAFIARAIGVRRLLAVAAGALAFVWPYVVVWQSVREGGFREVVVCCGLVALLCAVRAGRIRAGLPTFGLLGIAFGLGWWASPEIVYFVLPCLVLLSLWFLRVAEGRSRAVLAMGVGALAGSLPWWYTNAHTGFASLRPGSLPYDAGVTYVGRLSVFFHFQLPLQLGVRAIETGAWIGGPVVGPMLYLLLLVLVIAAVVVAVLRALRGSRDEIPLAFAAGVVAYPFLYAAIPGTGFWHDGRYGIYLPALLVLLFVSVLSPGPIESVATPGPPGPARRARAHARGARVGAGPRALAAAVGIMGALCLTVAGAHAAGVPVTTAFFSGWHSGDDDMQQVVAAMRAHHIEDAYANYWTSYDLDFVSGDHPLVSPSHYLDPVRSKPIAAEVGASRDPAWLFFAPGRTAAATVDFSTPQQGPGPYTERTFEAVLRRQGIAYTVVKLGILDAVVPSAKLTVP
jgi:hypothetical protein